MQISKEDKEKFQLRDFLLIQYQILRTNIISFKPKQYSENRCKGFHFKLISENSTSVYIFTENILEITSEFNQFLQKYF